MTKIPGISDKIIPRSEFAAKKTNSYNNKRIDKIIEILINQLMLNMSYVCISMY